MQEVCKAIHPAWWQWHPPVGVAVGLAGLIAVFFPLIRSWDKISPKERASWVALFVTLFGIEFRTIYRDQIEKDQARDLATCQQMQQFRASVAGLENIVGGGSYTVLTLYSSTFGILTNKGSSSLHDVTMQISDDFVKEDLVKQHPVMTLDQFDKTYRTVHIGDMAAGSNSFQRFEKHPFTRRDGLISITITFLALNGTWTEELHVRPVWGTLATAIRVTGHTWPGDRDRVLYEEVTSNYPRENGKPVW